MFDSVSCQKNEPRSIDMIYRYSTMSSCCFRHLQFGKKSLIQFYIEERSSVNFANKMPRCWKPLPKRSEFRFQVSNTTGTNDSRDGACILNGEVGIPTGTDSGCLGFYLLGLWKVGYVLPVPGTVEENSFSSSFVTSYYRTWFPS